MGKKNWDYDSEEWQRHKARLRVEYAVKTNRMRRERCECCLNIETIPHHENVEYPYQVRWLCKSCLEDVKSYITLPPKQYDPIFNIKCPHIRRSELVGNTIASPVKKLDALRREENAIQELNSINDMKNYVHQQIAEMLLDWVPNREPAEHLAKQLYTFVKMNIVPEPSPYTMKLVTQSEQRKKQTVNDSTL